MKSIVNKSNKKAAFTIVELLTVMSIIVILIGLLVPAMNQVKIFAKEVKQKAQFNAISVALEFFIKSPLKSVIAFSILNCEPACKLIAELRLLK